MTAKELHTRQQWTLAQKIDHSLGVIDQFIAKTDGKVYLAFSGGKDSTVLMHLCEILKKDIPCVFVNTGCEYPDIVRFVYEMREEGHNIIILRPTSTPRKVWSQYGFPLVSKQVAEGIHKVRTNPNSLTSKRVLGIYDSQSLFVVNKKWRYLISEPYSVSNKCCQKLKKDPINKFRKESGLYPIIGTMASESLLRTNNYIKRGGCNVFGENAQSLPLSIWTDDDIWAFIRQNNIRIADIYHKGAQRTGCVACGFGCQFPQDHRLQLLHEQYPKYYDMIMKFENNGITYRQALREMLSKCGLMLPDENPQLTLF